VNRGRLQVYLSYAPGVGTTCALLNEGHRRAELGTEVVAAIAETHGRPHTEAAAGHG
jgi:two-component system, OmpR family, sensor histidine kinase KdpD